MGAAVVWAFCCFSLVLSAFVYFVGFSLPALQLYYLLVVASPSSVWLLVLFIEVWLPWWLRFSLFQCMFYCCVPCNSLGMVEGHFEVCAPLKSVEGPFEVCASSEIVCFAFDCSPLWLLWVESFI
jgi:hypothetical protein